MIPTPKHNHNLIDRDRDIRPSLHVFGHSFVGWVERSETHQCTLPISRDVVPRVQPPTRYVVPPPLSSFRSSRFALSAGDLAATTGGSPTASVRYCIKFVCRYESSSPGLPATPRGLRTKPSRSIRSAGFLLSRTRCRWFVSGSPAGSRPQLEPRSLPHSLLALRYSLLLPLRNPRFRLTSTSRGPRLSIMSGTAMHSPAAACAGRSA